MILNVYFENEFIGTLESDERRLMRFTYNEVALSDPARYQISVRLPVRETPYENRDASPFFENLIPEAETLDLVTLAERFDPSETVRILGSIGGECAGAVSLWPEERIPPSKPEYEDCPPEALDAFFDVAQSGEYLRAYLEGRQSMSGAQTKLVFLKESNTYYLPLNGAPSNILLKKEKERFPGLVQNELASLRLMRAASVPVIYSSACQLVEGVFETPRYDRVGDRRSSITRLHQEDFCQATGKRPYAKYESRGGPNLGDIRILIQKHSVDPLTDVEIVARWAIANAVIGNHDGHAKNLSFLRTSDGLRLAPVYDVVCTEAYEFLGKNLAILIGGRPNLASFDDTAIEKFARTFLFSKGTARDLIDEVVDSIDSSLDAVLHDIEMDGGAHSILQKMQSLVKAKCTEWFA